MARLSFSLEGMKTSESHLKTFFERVKGESSFGEPASTVQRVPDLLSPGTVLDLGAGDGRHALYLASHGFQVRAVDASPSALEKLKALAAEKELSIETELADAARYTIDKRYDVVIVALLFQCLDEESSLRLLKQIQGQTQPGGINVIHVFTKTGDRYRLDQTEDPGAFYPDDGWLSQQYKDWALIEFNSSSSPLIGKFNEDGSPMMSVVERVIARKRDV